VKERVSVRSIRKELRGGSFGDIARELRRWKQDEDYQPAIEQVALPEVTSAYRKGVHAAGRPGVSP
jgi:hypothetical protein